MDNKLQSLINDARSILITSHISPDPDAVCSVLLLGKTLTHNFTDKKVTTTVEERPENLNYLSGYDQLIQQSLVASIDSTKPDLIIIVDAMSYARCTRGNAAEVISKVKDLGTKLVIIDHHEPDGRDEAEVYINQGSPAAVQDVYEVCFDQLGLSKPNDFAEITMTGLYSDSGGFVYDNPRFKETYKIVVELIGRGVSLEKIKAKLEHFSEDSILALGELAQNLQHHNDYSYSYISDDFTAKWVADNKAYEDMHMAVGIFANHYLRSIEGRPWGFIVYRDLAGGENIYGVSFRAIAGTKDVSKIASDLGGGGHKPAAGAKIKANSAADAIDIVERVINQYSS